MLIRSLEGIKDFTIKDSFLVGSYSFVDDARFTSLCKEVSQFVKDAQPNQHIFVFQGKYYVFLSSTEKSDPNTLVYSMRFRAKDFGIPTPDVSLDFFEQWFIVTDPEKAPGRKHDIELEQKHVAEQRHIHQAYRANPMDSGALTGRHVKASRKFRTRNKNISSDYESMKKRGTLLGFSKTQPIKLRSNKTQSRLVEVKLLHRYENKTTLHSSDLRPGHHRNTKLYSNGNVIKGLKELLQKRNDI